MRVMLGSTLLAVLFGSWAVAGPQGEHVIRGNVQFERAGNTTTIHASNRAIINYSSFDIGRQETVQFVQPSATSAVLNRIRSAEPTYIDGALRANGIVYIVNPSGVIFGLGSVVDVAGVYAAASSISNADFVAGINRFTDSAGTVANYGTIVGRTVNLIGRHVENHGSIVADGGMVTMVAGDDVLLTEEIGGHIMVKLEGSAEPAAGAAAEKPGVENTGSVDADKGTVMLAAGDMFSIAARSAGSIKAKDVTVQGQAGVTEVSGSIDASDKSPAGQGGNVKVLGEKVALNGADIDASGTNGGGEVLVGGDYRGEGDVPTAEYTYVDEGSSINADAIGNGNGGKVIVWSDEATGFFGSITARGGARGGDGGFIETSGKEHLTIGSWDIDAGAPAGNGGKWLLDPRNVEVRTGANANGSWAGGVFTPTGDDADASIDAAAPDGVVAVLESGTNVEITTGGTGTQDGDIVVVNDIVVDLSSNGEVTLTLTAADDVTVNGNITASNDELNVVLTAGGGVTGAVTITGNVTTNGGDFSSSGTTFNNTGGAITTAGGIVTIVSSGSVTVGANIDSGAGAMSIASGSSGSGNLGFAAGVTLASDSISLRAGDGDGGTATAVVDATTNTPTFEDDAGTGAPATFTLRQDAAITNAILPANTQFTGSASPATYNIQSDDGGVSLTVNAKIAGSAVVVTGLTGDDAYQVTSAGAAQAGSITINAGAGDDTLTVDFSGGAELPNGGVTFNGETQTSGDSMVLQNLSPTTVTHTLNNATDGSVAVDSETINYTGLEPITDNLSATNRVFTFTGSPGTVTLADAGGAGDNISAVSSTASETVTFTVPSGTLTINAGAGNTTINLNGIDSGFGGTLNVNGDAGNDTFNIASGVTISGAINGGTNTDTLVMADGTNAWGITGAGSGTLGAVTGGWSNMETLTGGSGVDTFTLGAAGSIADLYGGGNDDVFNFNGGGLTGTANGDAGNDTFTFANAATIAGSINGGAGTDTLSFASYATSRTVTLSGTGASNGFAGTETSITGTFDNINVVTGSTAATGDSLTGINATAAWGIDGTNQYTSTNTLDFSNFETLTGGTEVDTFTLSAGGAVTNMNGGDNDDVWYLNGGTMSGTASGGAGDDWFTIGAGATFTGAIAGGTGNDTLEKVSGGVWAINASGGGSLSGLGGSWTTMETLIGGTGVDNFTLGASGVIVNLNGGGNNDYFDLATGTISGNVNGDAGDDEFRFGDAMTVGGNIDGGSGTDKLNWSSYSLSRTITLSGVGTTDGLAGDETSIGGTFDNIDEVVGGGASDSLTGMTTGDGIWTLDGGATETYASGASTLVFSSIETLSGGDGADTLNLSGSGSLANFNGNNGDDVFNLNGGTMTGTMSGGANDDTFNIGAGASFAGACDGGTGNDTLSKADGTNAWNITGAGSGTVGGLTGGWSNMETLTGGSAVDTFTLGAAGSITSLNGGGSDDVFNINGGGLTGTASGGAGNDTFNFADTATIAGSIDGGAGTDTLNLASYAASRTVTLSGVGTTDGFAGTETSITGTFDNIEVVAGSTAATGDSLTGVNATAAWGIDGTNQYTSTNTLDFSNFETLTGGTGADTFTLSAGGSVTNLNGGGNNDVFNINGGTLSGTASGGAGDDTFDIADTVTVAGSIDGGAGTDTLDLASYAASRTVTLSGTGTSDGFAGDETSITGTFDNIDAVIGSSSATGDSLTGINATAVWALGGTNTYTSTNALTFSNIEDLAGGSGADTFDFADAATVGGGIDGAGGTDTLDWADYTTARAVVLTGTGTTDGFDGTQASITSGFSNIDGVVGSSSATTDSLSGINAAAAWVVDGTNTYTSTNALSFGNINVLNGGSNDDALTVDFSGGNPVPTGGLTFNGGGQALSDSIALTGGSPTDVDHTFVSASSGSVVVTDDSPVYTATINYTGLEPITDNMSATDRSFTFGNTADTIVVADEGTLNNNISRVTSGASETVTFTNPTNSLTINTGQAGGGSDTVAVAPDNSAPATPYAGTITVNASEGLIVGSGGTGITTGGGVRLATTDGPVTVTQAITTSGAGDVDIVAGDAVAGDSHTVALQAAVTASGMVVRINADHDVTQTAAGLITASSLGVLAGDAITLTQSNAVSTFAAESTGASAAVQFTDTGALSIGTVNDAVTAVFGKNLIGIVTNNGDVTVECGANLTLTNATDAGGGAVQFETTGSNTDILDGSSPVDAVDVTAQSVTWITAGPGSGDVGTATDDIEMSVAHEYAGQVNGTVYTSNVAGDLTVHVSGTYSGSSSVTAGYKLTMDGVGNDVVLDAASLTCVDGEVEINCNSLTVQNATTINSEDGLIDINCDTFALSNGTIESGQNSTNGAIEITTTGVLGTGNVSITGGRILSNGSGDVQITSVGNLSLSGGVAPDGTITVSGAGEIFITSAVNVTDNDTTARLIAPDLRIDAVSGIGTSAANPLNTNVTNLAVRNTTSGGIYIQDADWLNVGGGSLLIAGTSVAYTGTVADAAIRSGSPMTVTGPMTISTSIAYVATGSVAAGDDLTVTGGTITLDSASAVTLGLQAGDNVVINADIRSQGGGSHVVDIQSDTEIDGSGDVSLTGGSIAPTAGALEIDIDSADTVTDSDATVRLTATSLKVDAVNGIGTSANPLNTQVTNLAVRNTTNGGIYVQNTGALVIGGGLLMDGTNAVVESDTATDGFIQASSPLTIGSPAAHNGSFTYQASDSGAAGDDLTINAAVTLTSATGSVLSFIAGDNVQQ
ncbi:MAG: filamentous hemagglutinin N-terminal domain-containing protein, partial [Phycisphaerae bacterium]